MSFSGHVAAYYHWADEQNPEQPKKVCYLIYQVITQKVCDNDVIHLTLLQSCFHDIQILTEQQWMKQSCMNCPYLKNIYINGASMKLIYINGQ